MRRMLVVVLASLVALSTFGAPAYASDDACRALTDRTVRFPVGGAKHVVFAVAPDYGVSTVTVTECVRRGWKWHSVRQVDGWAGRAGFAPVGEKREGDGRTPSGSYTFTEAFGEGDPGTRLRYRQLRSTGDCWGSTVTDKRYNRYFSGNCGPDDEDISAIMLSGPYQQAVVIDYNRRPVVPGHGSAIFFHVSSDKPTAGCIAIKLPALISVMRDLRPGDRMVMGVKADVFRR